MTELMHTLDRTILICAKRSTVFRYFTDSKRFADWWGAGSQIEGKAGGSLRIFMPGGITASGEVLEITPNEKIVFTYGFDSGTPIPPGGSRVTVTLQDHPEGTLLSLHHEFADTATRDHHVQGWRYQLALFANVAAQEEHAGIQRTVDGYFAMWNMIDDTERRNAMEGLLIPNVTFKDRFSCTSNADDLNAHIAAGKQFMPGLTITRDGETQQCQGTAITNWIAHRADGTEAGRGINVFHLTPEGLIRDIVGFWKM